MNDAYKKPKSLESATLPPGRPYARNKPPQNVLPGRAYSVNDRVTMPTDFFRVMWCMVDGVYMPTKETTFSKNARSSYWQFLNKHIFPALGDFLMEDITPAMISKLLLNFQKNGYAHASAVKLYNILNGIFQMAFLDDTVRSNPRLRVKRPAPRKDEKS